MATPVLSLTQQDNTPLSVMNFGVVDAGTNSGGSIVRIWNNLANSPNIAAASNPAITTKTFNGYDSGDSIPNGEQVVTQQFIQVLSLSTGATQYVPIGGPNTAPIGDAVQQAGNPPPPLQISPNGYAEVQLRANIPQSAQPGNINFIIRVSFQFS